MKFRTEYVAEKAPFSLSPDAPVVLLGSCFSENIAVRMRRCLWDAVNPFGTLYNPLSIAKALHATLFSEHCQMVFDDSLFETGGKTCSWLFDSKLSAETAEDCRRAFQRRRDELERALGKAKALFVTFGTSWCYYLADREDYVVANCHKQPSERFVRKRISPDGIVKVWERMADLLRERYPELEIVFTVSPVRHLKDGFEGNSHSKAVLLLGVEELCRRKGWCHYFPAYEIVNDDLRDYRFYASDLVHPSEEGVEYIWAIFKATYMDPTGERILREGENLFKAWNHRSLPDSTEIPSLEKLDRERRRKGEIQLRHAAFRALHPAVLPLE